MNVSAVAQELAAEQRDAVAAQRDDAVEAGDAAAVEEGDAAAVEAGDAGAVEAGDAAAVEEGDAATVEAGDAGAVEAGDAAAVEAGAVEQRDAVAEQRHDAEDGLLFLNDEARARLFGVRVLSSYFADCARIFTENHPRVLHRRCSMIIDGPICPYKSYLMQIPESEREEHIEKMFTPVAYMCLVRGTIGVEQFRAVRDDIFRTFKQHVRFGDNPDSFAVLLSKFEILVLRVVNEGLQRKYAQKMLELASADKVSSLALLEMYRRMLALALLDMSRRMLALALLEMSRRMLAHALLERLMCIRHAVVLDTR